MNACKEAKAATATNRATSTSLQMVFNLVLQSPNMISPCLFCESSRIAAFEPSLSPLLLKVNPKQSNSLYNYGYIILDTWHIGQIQCLPRLCRRPNYLNRPPLLCSTLEEKNNACFLKYNLSTCESHCWTWWLQRLARVRFYFIISVIIFPFSLHRVPVLYTTNCKV